MIALSQFKNIVGLIYLCIAVWMSISLLPKSTVLKDIYYIHTHLNLAFYVACKGRIKIIDRLVIMFAVERGIFNVLVAFGAWDAYAEGPHFVLIALFLLATLITSLNGRSNIFFR
jgi:hypothetical protein